MTAENFPSVASEPTSYTPDTAEECTCPKCGDDAYRIERGGGMRRYICRDCRMGYDELMLMANYGEDWDRVRAWVLNREGRECWQCGAEESLHVHHIEKMLWYETTDEAHRPENLVALCEDCHQELENEPEAFEEPMADA